MLDRILAMFGLAQRIERPAPPKLDPLSAQIKIASQRNERASIAAQETLESFAMSDTLRRVAERMK